MAAGPTTMPVLEADGSTIRTLLGVQDGSNQFSAGAMLVHPTTGAALIGQATKANSLPVAIASNQVGTAGTPSTDVVTVQGITNGTAVPVTSSAPTPASSTATIANAASLSGAVDLGSAKEVLRLVMPSAWTAASLTMQVSDDGTNYNDFYDAFGVEYTVTVSASRNIVLPMGDLRGVRYLKVRSGTSASPVAQGASRDILIVAR